MRPIEYCYPEQSQYNIDLEELQHSTPAPYQRVSIATLLLPIGTNEQKQ
jgi:hypothetical protein